MPVYVYEAKEGEKGCARCRGGFEIAQSLKDDRLTVCPVHIHRQHTGFWLTCCINLHACYLPQLLFGISRQSLLVRCDSLQPALLHILCCYAPGIRTDIVRCTSLKTIGQDVICRTFPAHMLNHLATALIGW